MTMTRPTTDQITHKGQLLSSVLDRAVNVLDYGAQGDGVTDDFDALIAAFNAVKNAGGGTLYIPNTPNGYYLRYGTYCNLAGATNISIISDGATLKLQGGTASQTQDLGVFVLGGATFTASNLVISGLRFVAASTVTRYQNGSGNDDILFDLEVELGNANILEQATFRTAIGLNGSVSNVTISDCYFGPHIHYGVIVKNGNPKSRHVILDNLVFEGINAMCLQPSNIDHLIISNMISRNKLGSGFDHFLYSTDSCSHVQISNVSIRNDVKLVQGGGINITGANNATATNIHIENLAGNGIILGDDATNYALSNIVIKSSGSTGTPVLRIRESNNTGVSNLAISNLVIEDCPWAIYPSSGINIVIDNFVINGATTKALESGDGSFDMRMSNGVISNSGGTSSQCIRMIGSTGLRKLKMTNVDFIYSSFVPTLTNAVATAGSTAVNKVEFDSCSFQSLAGTAAGNCVTGTTDTLTMRNCWQTGFAALQATNIAATRIAASPNGQLTLTADSATPSVALGDTFITANTTATSLTNFTGGVPGQQIAVLVNDANTTFDFTGTSLKGNNGVDYVASSGDVIFAKRIGSNWHCTISQG